MPCKTALFIFSVKAENHGITLYYKVLSFHRVLSFTEWLKFNLGSKDRFKGVGWSVIFPYLYHEIWKDRINVSLKNQNPAQPNTIIQRALTLARLRTKGGTYTR